MCVCVCVSGSHATVQRLALHAWQRHAHRERAEVAMARLIQPKIEHDAVLIAGVRAPSASSKL